MRRTSRSTIVLLVVVVLGFLGSALPAQAAVLPPRTNFRGLDMVEWQRAYFRWATGEVGGTSLADCGRVVTRGVFFVAPALAPPPPRIDCDLDPGTPVLALVTAAFSEIPTWGADDAAVLADARATFAGWTDVSVTFDGEPVSLAGRYREAPAYDVRIEDGSFFDEICENLAPPCLVDFEPPGPVRMASVGQWIIIPPMPPGEHTLVTQATFFGTTLSPLTFRFHVG